MSPAVRTVIIVLVLALSAAGGYFAYQSLTPSEGQARPLQAATVFDLPDFSLPDLAGTPRSIRGFADDRGLIVNFWATWCAPCLREIPLLTEFHALKADSAQVVGIAVDRLDDVTAFAPQLNINYPILVGEADAMEAAQGFGVEFLTLPFTVFAAPRGQILAVHTGEVTAGDLDNYAAVLTEIAAGTLSLEGARQRMSGRL